MKIHCINWRAAFQVAYSLGRNGARTTLVRKNGVWIVTVA